MFLGELKETNVLRWDLGFCGLPVITTESTPIVSWARKLCQWASVYNTRTLAHFHGTQTLVQLVTPLFQKTKCPLREEDRDDIWNSWTSADNYWGKESTLLANFCWLFICVLLLNPHLHAIYQRVTSVPAVWKDPVFHNACHSNMNFCCYFGSLMKCFQHAWFHHLLWKTALSAVEWCRSNGFSHLK